MRADPLMRRYTDAVRTTVQIDDDVLEAARQIAAVDGRSLGRVFTGSFLCATNQAAMVADTVPIRPMPTIITSEPMNLPTTVTGYVSP